MARRTHIAGPDQIGSSLAPKELSKQEFGRRLYTLMLGKGWTQAELARRADVLRDSVSNYIRGQVMPTHENASKLAAALGVSVDELLPNVAQQAIAADSPSIDLRVSSADPSKAWLQVNRLVRTSTATQIITLLEADDAANGN